MEDKRKKPLILFRDGMYGALNS